MFFVFEGMDGSGKSTQARLLERFLRQERKRNVLLVREPGGTELGEQVRELLLGKGSEGLATETELFLFMAARSHLVRTRLLPALESGQIVISDRFVWSSVVYQGLAGDVDPEDVLRMGRLATAGLEITRTFLIDAEPEVAHGRAVGRNRMEDRGLDFQRRVRAGFLGLAREGGPSVVTVDGNEAPDVVHAKVLAALPEELRL